jgi:hypothetical protein
MGIGGCPFIFVFSLAMCFLFFFAGDMGFTVLCSYDILYASIA